MGVRSKGGKIQDSSQIRLRNLATGMFLDFKNGVALRESGEARTSRMKIVGANPKHHAGCLILYGDDVQFVAEGKGVFHCI